MSKHDPPASRRAACTGAAMPGKGAGIAAVSNALCRRSQGNNSGLV